MNQGAFFSATVLALSLLAMAPTPASAAPIPGNHGCMGPWVGRGQNSGSSSYWTIDLTLTGSPHGARCGTIEYKNPACGGFLDECRLVGADIHTQENYTHSESSCAPAGRVVIRCEGNQMRYSWIGWEQVDTILHRPPGYSPPANRPGPSGGTTPPTPPTGTTTPPTGTTQVPGDTPLPPPVVPHHPPLQQNGPPSGQSPTGSPPAKVGGCGCATTAPLGSLHPAAPLLSIALLLLLRPLRRRR